MGEVTPPHEKYKWGGGGGGGATILPNTDFVNTKVQDNCKFTAVNSSGELLYCYNRFLHLV